MVVPVFVVVLNEAGGVAALVICTKAHVVAVLTAAVGPRALHVPVKVVPILPIILPLFVVPVVVIVVPKIFRAFGPDSKLRVGTLAGLVAEGIVVVPLDIAGAVAAVFVLAVVDVITIL
jgi:hypothetical protein